MGSKAVSLRQADRGHWAAFWIEAHVAADERGLAQHRAEDRTPEHMQQEYELTCERAGVWAAAEAQQGEAEQQVAQPEPPGEHDEGDLWSCSKRRSMNNMHH